MKRLVLKFGGTSVGNITKIKNVANIVKKKHEEGNEIIVVVSAMSGVTNDLIKKSLDTLYFFKRTMLADPRFQHSNHSSNHQRLNRF